MQIQNGLPFVPRYATPQTSRKNPVSGNLASALTPGQQAELEAQERSIREHPPLKDPNNNVWGYPSPSMLLGDDYAAWKAQQPEETPPNEGGGLTEENLNYLRERYSGSLSWNEKMGVLEDLYKMGVLDKEQCEEAAGDETVIITGNINDPTWGGVVYLDYDPVECSQWAKAWEHIYLHSPAAGFQQLEDILTWAKAHSSLSQENGTVSISE